MKLTELSATRPVKQITKVFESHFDQRINFDSLSQSQLRQLYQKVRRTLDEHQQSTARHFGERNPVYLKLMMMEQALMQRISEEEIAVVDVNSPEMKKIQDKVKSKQQLTPDEQKKANALLAVKTENNTGNFLRESEIQQAQVVLAAQDMVDNIQGMLEDTTEMQFKELPALVDSIKNQVGIDQATQFNTDAQAALSGLVQNLQTSKQQLETALGVITGQSAVPVVPGTDMEPAADLDINTDIEVDQNLEPDEEVTPIPTQSLGRERR